MSNSDKPRIGFIGLGLMGSAMVSRLQDLDYPLTVVANRSREAIDKAVSRGATEVGSAREVAAASDVVLLCMDTSAAVESRMFGPDGAIAGIKADGIIIDHGTSLPGSTKRIGAALAEKGAHYLDAPLARTPTFALEGKLNIMVGGDEAVYTRVKPLLDDLGENVFHVGALGAGNTLKLINNFFAMTTACAMSEAFAMADVAGIPRDQLYQIMSAGPLRSGMMDWIKGRAVDGVPDMLAFSIANARKDVGYYATMADELGAPSFISPATKQVLGLAKQQGYAKRMVPEMVDYIAEVFGGKDQS